MAKPKRIIKILLALIIGACLFASGILLYFYLEYLIWIVTVIPTFLSFLMQGMKADA